MQQATKVYYIVWITREKAMAPHSSTLAWKTPWMEEPGRLQSMGLWRVGLESISCNNLWWKIISKIIYVCLYNWITLLCIWNNCTSTKYVYIKKRSTSMTLKLFLISVGLMIQIRRQVPFPCSVFWAASNASLSSISNF